MYSIKTEKGTLFQDKAKKCHFADTVPPDAKSEFSFVIAIDLVLKEAANCSNIHITKKVVPKLTNYRTY